VEDILPLMDELAPLGLKLAQQLLAAMNVGPERIQGYGKGAIVGEAGELEHGALWHVPGGYAMRELLGWKGDAAAYKAGQGSGQRRDIRVDAVVVREEGLGAVGHAEIVLRNGIGRGATVAALLPNIPAMLECHHFVPMAGAVLNSINTRLDAGRLTALYGAEGDGTSYAVVHVAAAAVMWLAWHAATLNAAFGAQPDWRQVEPCACGIP
jgi:hypothetical protein